MSHTPAHNVIVQIKIKLLGVTKPPVWRRVQLRADTRLDQLHEILQAALGWENYHMHCFAIGGEEFGQPDPGLDHADERRVTLGELVDLGARFRYTYDFGDDWEHEILVEDLLDPDPDTHYPSLVAAKGACPPEDCGGPLGIRRPKTRPRRPQQRTAPRHARLARPRQRRRIRPQRHRHRPARTRTRAQRRQPVTPEAPASGPANSIQLVFGIFAALAESERELISERTIAGLASARARGRKGGRPFKMTPAKLRLAASMGQPDTKVSELCTELGITRQTLYRHVSPTGQLRPDGPKLLADSRRKAPRA